MLEGYINSVLSNESILSAIPDGIYIILILLATAAITYALLLQLRYKNSMQIIRGEDLKRILEDETENSYDFSDKPHLERMISNIKYYMKNSNRIYPGSINSIAAEAMMPLNRIGKSLNFIRISAPLFGLSGTIIGLKLLFTTGDIANNSDFMSAVAVALNTTFLGAAIAILSSFILTRIYSPRLHIVHNELETAENMIIELQAERYSNTGNELAEIYKTSKDYHSTMAKMLLRTIEATENISRQFEKINSGFDKQAQVMTSYYNLLTKLQAKTSQIENEQLANKLKNRPVTVSQVQVKERDIYDKHI